MARLVIDGKQIDTKEDQTILEAAKNAGIAIPTLCHAEGIGSRTSCMICVVEDTRDARTLPACAAKVEDGMVVDAAFSGNGCAISQATASMMMEEIVGLSVDELKTWDKDYILEMLGIEIGPVRLKCALLPLKALKAGVWGLEEWPE